MFLLQISILKLRITGFVFFVHRLKLDLFPPWSERKEEPNLLGVLERANLNYWTQQNMHLPSLSRRRKQILFPERFLVI
jgi:hypothetical protein